MIKNRINVRDSNRDIQIKVKMRVLDYKKLYEKTKFLVEK